MTEPVKPGNPRGLDQEELDRFRGIRYLTNHWSRPISPRSYYWYLTFDHCAELQAMAKRCQQFILLPYYDLTLTADLHMTLDRIAFEGDISPQELAAITAAAETRCSTIAPLEVTVNSVGGTSSAIGFNAYPRQSIQSLRDGLRAATQATHPAANVKPSAFHPHITIAYCSSDGIDATEVIAAVEELNESATTELTVEYVSLVLLTRLPRSYKWETVTRIPLLGRRPAEDAQL